MQPDSPEDTNAPSDGKAARRRRPRYAGTHPRRFQERYKEQQPDRYPEMQDHIRAKGNTPAGTHVPVLVHEVLECLRPTAGDVVVDCTVGYGGHAMEFLRRIGPAGRLIGLDVDGEQLERTRRRLREFARTLGPAVEPEAPAGGPLPFQVSLHRSNFAGVGKVLAAEGLDGCDVLFADLGVSSMQVDDPARGFSYKRDAPLDMRMDHRRSRTAADLLASMAEREIAAALRDLADEPDADAIAAAIARQRASQPIRRTLDLVRLIFDVKGVTRRDWRTRAAAGGLHPAARTFQGLRILVNDELNSLAQFLRSAPFCLRPGGRVAIITFHSGEDRLVKHAFRDGLRAGVYEAASGEVIRPAPQERRGNPRSASAKLRWARKSGE